MRPLTIRLLSVRRSLPLFLAIVVCLAIWQVWLTWRLMEQDRNLAAQQSLQRLEQIAGLAAFQLAGRTRRMGPRPARIGRPPASSRRQAQASATGHVDPAAPRSVSAYPAKSLLFVPDPPSASPLPEAFDAAGKLEFRDLNFDRAVEVLRPLTEQPATRAEAWLRIARLERKRNHPEAALAAYERCPGRPPSAPTACHTRC